MDSRCRKLCVWLLLCTGLRTVNTLTLTASSTPNPAVKGTTSKHTVRCDFTLVTNDLFQQLQLFLMGGASDRLIAQMFADRNPQWSASVPENLNGRGLLGGSRDRGFLTLALNDTQCIDSERSYKCLIQYTTDNAVQPGRIQTTTVNVEAAPKAPAAMVVSPQSENITEYSEMTFTCSGNVGRPGGTFQWFTFNDNDYSSMTNVTDQATQGAETPDTNSGESCTYTRNSGLTLNVTRTQPGKRLVVRCRVYHPTQGSSNSLACNDPNTDYCVMSPQIDVQYPVTVGVRSNTVIAAEGTEQTLICNTQGNPPAYLIEWKREGEKDTLSTGNLLTLSQLTLSDTGRYICTAYNIIEGSTRQDSVAVTLTVVMTTSPLPTTTLTSTSTNFAAGTGSTETSQANTDSGTMGYRIALGLVSSILVLLIVINVVVIVWLKSLHWILPCADSNNVHRSDYANNRSNSQPYVFSNSNTFEANGPGMSAGSYDDLNVTNVDLKDVYSEIGHRDPYTDVTNTSTRITGAAESPYDRLNESDIGLRNNYSQFGHR